MSYLKPQIDIAYFCGRNESGDQALAEGNKITIAGMEGHFAGFQFCQTAEVTRFLDGPGAGARDAVHVVFAGEKVRPEYPETVPTIENCETLQDVRTLPLEALVRMKLTSFCDKDRVHVRDMLEVGLIDAHWLDRFSPTIRERLQELIDSPDG